jgi:hypothetical protein
VYAMFGGMASNGTAATTIGAGWDALQCDTVAPPAHGVVVDLVNNSLAWPVRNVSSLAVSLVITHNEQNSSREFFFRLWNQTKGEQVGIAAPIGIARNQGVTNASFVVPVVVQAGYENDELVFQVGGTSDVITVLVWDAIRIWTHNVGQYFGDISSAASAMTVGRAVTHGFDEGFK